MSFMFYVLLSAISFYRKLKEKLYFQRDKLRHRKLRRLEFEVGKIVLKNLKEQVQFVSNLGY
jgi:hypothetical protein